ncbi:MAG: flagellar export chaperone FliS [Myxococcales bacterium]|nr:flagellar export chaperone FliS [Myxococcota bacterium]MDW8283340.1 flagellar export chaperone FliS [Myxococcales bacterium]
MRAEDALLHYRQQALEFASPGEILVKLLDAVVQSCNEARTHILRQNPAAKGLSIGRAIAILGELEATLRHEVAPDLTARLASLYQFARDRLLSASIHMDVTGVDEALKAIQPIRDAYAHVVRQMEQRADVQPAPAGFKAKLE